MALRTAISSPGGDFKVSYFLFRSWFLMLPERSEDLHKRIRNDVMLTRYCQNYVPVKWECGSVTFRLSGSVSFQNWGECAQNKWECGSVSFQIGGSVCGYGSV